MNPSKSQASGHSSTATSTLPDGNCCGPRENEAAGYLGLIRERVRADLELHHLAHHVFADWLNVLQRTSRVGAPDASALPARLRIIDSPVQALGVKPHRIGN